MKTTDLGYGWFANLNDDGTMTVRNCDKGQRIDLPSDSVRTLRGIFNEAGRPMTAEDTFNSTTGNKPKADPRGKLESECSTAEREMIAEYYAGAHPSNYPPIRNQARWTFDQKHGAKLFAGYL